MKSTRKNLMQPSDWWTAFETQAKKEGKNLSEWMGECCLANLPDSVVQTLTDRIGPGKPRKENK